MRFYEEYTAAAIEFYLKTDRGSLKNEAETRDWQAVDRTIEALDPRMRTREKLEHLKYNTEASALERLE